MATIIVKNNSGSAVSIDDLGITLANASQRTLVQDDAGEFTIDELDGSTNLYTLVNAGTLVLNDGSTDLTNIQGLSHTSIETDWEIGSTYYTQAQLEASGDSAVHWDNITDTPFLAGVNWLEAAIGRIEGYQAAAPGSPVEGMFYIDSDDDHAYRYTSSSWVDQGIPTDADRYVDKDTKDVFQYSADSTAWTTITPSADDAIIVADDGDLKQAQYVFNGSDWIKIADVDWGDHGSLGGLGDDDHSQYHNDVRGDIRYHPQSNFYTSSQGSSTAILADATGKIDVSFLPTIVSDHGDLDGLGDDDHSQYHNDTRGDARYHIQGSFYDTSQGTATGVWTDATGKIDVTFLPDIVTDHGDLSGLGDDDHSQYHNDTRGDARYYQQSQFYNTSQGTGTPILADATGKIDVSFLPSADVNSMAAVFGRGRSNMGSQWLRGVGGIPSNLSGPRMALNATIVGMSVQTNGNSNATFYIRRNGTTTNLTNLALSGSDGAQTYALTVDIDAGDFIGVYMDVTSGNVDYPTITVWYIWR